MGNARTGDVVTEEQGRHLDGVNWQEIRDLLMALEQSSVVELNLEVEGFRLNLRKGETSDRGAVSSSDSPLPPQGSSPSPEGSTGVTPEIASASPGPAKTHWVDVTSPMVGTFYSASAPGEPDFVKTGDRVRKGQTLCIIEAMKLMNELEAEVEGQIAEILVSNSQPVEFGQVLIRIDPAA